MRLDTRALLVPLIGIALLLSGCSGNTSINGEEPEPAGTPVTTTPGGSTSEDAVAEYVTCLHEHGLDNAVANPDGSVSYEFTEDDLDDNGVISAGAGDTSAIETACQEAVPGYTPPNENER